MLSQRLTLLYQLASCQKIAQLCTSNILRLAVLELYVGCNIVVTFELRDKLCLWRTQNEKNLILDVIGEVPMVQVLCCSWKGNLKERKQEAKAYKDMDWRPAAIDTEKQTSIMKLKGYQKDMAKGDTPTFLIEDGNQKRGNNYLRMRCNKRQPDAAQFLLFSCRPCQVWSHSAYPLPSYSVFPADDVTLRCDLTFHLWPWTYAVDRLRSPLSNSVQNLSEIEQSAAELLQFEYLALWPWTCITCCAMLWDSLHEV